MKPLLRLAVITAAIGAIASVGVAPVAAVSGDTAQAVSPTIVGGDPATQPYSFEGSLLLDHGDGRGPRFHCGVNLIAKFGDDRAVIELARQVHVTATTALMRRLANTSWFETNAHCVTDINTLSTKPFDPSLLRVAIGSNLRSAETAYPVVQVAVNPFWNWTHATGPHGEQGDEALVVVPVEVPEQPVRIGFSGLGETLRLIGWGADHRGRLRCVAGPVAATGLHRGRVVAVRGGGPACGHR